MPMQQSSTCSASIYCGCVPGGHSCPTQHVCAPYHGAVRWICSSYPWGGWCWGGIAASRVLWPCSTRLGAQALPNCADNIVAETHGAELAISLYEKYRQLCQQQSLTPLPLDRIQGDIKPLLQHLDFRGRFRRKDLINLVHQFHARRSRIAPDSITEYRPREANALADYLAGQASAWLLQKGNTQVPTAVPFPIQVDPPYDLLLQANAVLLGPHREGKIVLILREKPGCSIAQFARFAC